MQELLEQGGAPPLPPRAPRRARDRNTSRRRFAEALRTGVGWHLFVPPGTNLPYVVRVNECRHATTQPHGRSFWPGRVFSLISLSRSCYSFRYVVLACARA